MGDGFHGWIARPRFGYVSIQISIELSATIIVQEEFYLQPDDSALNGSPLIPAGQRIFTAFCVWRDFAKAARLTGTILRLAPARKRQAPGGNMRFGPFLGIAILLMILWLGGFLMFHVASGLIHLLLLFAVISLIIHFVTGSRTA
jgi:uncharacterized protein DUF5670